MDREKLLWSLAVLLLLGGGLVLGRRFMGPIGAIAPGDAALIPFRQWFWENRGLDLAVQVALIFAGALALAALLPLGDDERNEEE